MNARLKVVALLGIVFLAASLCRAGQAQQRGPSTPEEHVRAVRVSEKLQVDPLGPDVQSEREWLIKWLIQVPDISVKLCTTFLGDLGDSKSGYPGALIVTMMASQAAFVIEHPDKAKDDNAVYAAGVEGALKAYEAIHRKDSKYKLAQLENLIELREKHKLIEYVRKTATKCKSRS